MGNHGGCCLARIGERIRAIAAAAGDDGEVVEYCGGAWIISSEQLLVDGKRAPEQGFGLGIFALAEVKIPQIVD